MSSSPTRQQPPTSCAPAAIQLVTSAGAKAPDPVQVCAALSQASPRCGYATPGRPVTATAVRTAVGTSAGAEQFTPAARIAVLPFRTSYAEASGWPARVVPFATE